MKGDPTSDEELLSRVRKLAGGGRTRQEIASALGFKATSTLANRLVKASQRTGKPVPAFMHRSRKLTGPLIKEVEIRRRGKGETFGVNIPQQVLEQIGATRGDLLTVSASRGRIVLRPGSRNT